MALLLLPLLLATALPLALGNGYIKSVACDSRRMIIGLDKSSYLFKPHTFDAGFVVRVTNTPGCTAPIKWLPNIPLSPLVGFQVPYGSCGYKLKTIYGGGQQPKAFLAYLHFEAENASSISDVDLTGTNYTFAAYCVYPANTHSHVGVGVSTDGGGDNQGGNSTIPNNHVEMTLTRNGETPTNVKLGDMLNLTIDIPFDDDTYNATLPVNCEFNDGSASSGNILPFIIGGCPQRQLVGIDQIIDAMGQQNSSAYFINFRAFTFDGYEGLLTISCRLRLCLNVSFCRKACWGDMVQGDEPGADDDDEPGVVFEQTFDVAAEQPRERANRAAVKPTRATDPYTDTNQRATVHVTADVNWLLYVLAAAGACALFLLLLGCVCCCVCLLLSSGRRKQRRVDAAYRLPDGASVYPNVQIPHVMAK